MKIYLMFKDGTKLDLQEERYTIKREWAKPVMVKRPPTPPTVIVKSSFYEGDDDNDDQKGSVK